jgi:hypothetical protein
MQAQQLIEEALAVEIKNLVQAIGVEGARKWIDLVFDEIQTCEHGKVRGHYTDWDDEWCRGPSGIDGHPEEERLADIEVERRLEEQHR